MSKSPIFWQLSMEPTTLHTINCPDWQTGSFASSVIWSLPHHGLLFLPGVKPNAIYRVWRLGVRKILKWNNPTPVSLAKGSWMREGAIDSSLDGVMPSHSVRVVVKHCKIAKLPWGHKGQQGSPSVNNWRSAKLLIENKSKLFKCQLRLREALKKNIARLRNCPEVTSVNKGHKVSTRKDQQRYKLKVRKVSPMIF